jgi:bifunctional non-homologous end joining protein LigD
VNAVEVARRDKVFWPAAGFTKGDLVDYYERVAPVLLPHLRERPVTLRRFPDGVVGPSWYQTNCRARPDWLEIAVVRGTRGGRFEMCLLNDVRSLVWAASVGAIELHPFLHREGTVEPDYLVLDLDPGPGADVVDCCDLALAARALVGEDALVKTSGSVGLHVYVHCDGESYDETKARARAIAERLAEELPQRVVLSQRRDLRRGRVLIDWLQNDPMRSTVAPYSLRGMPWPTVSTPVRWDEVERCARERRAELLTFLADDALERVATQGDVWSSGASG